MKSNKTLGEERIPLLMLLHLLYQHLLSPDFVQPPHEYSSTPIQQDHKGNRKVPSPTSDPRERNRNGVYERGFKRGEAASPAGSLWWETMGSRANDEGLFLDSESIRVRGGFLVS
jgi:hypothetical protein